MKKFLSFIFICLSVFVITSCKDKISIDEISKTLSTYNFNIEYNLDNTLTVTQKLKYINNTNTLLNELNFHLYVNNFKEGAINKPVGVLSMEKAYPNGKNYALFDIISIGENNNKANYQLLGDDNDILKLSLDTPLNPSDTSIIDFKYSITIPNILHRFGYGNNTINLANFYPIACVYENGNWVTDPYNYNGDPFYSDMANYNATITTPSQYTLASSGNIDNISTSNNTKTYHVSAKAIRDFAFVLSDKFEVISQKVNNVNVMYYYYNDTLAQKHLQTAIDSLNTFNKLFGEYPYSTLSVVKCNFVHGGMEYPNLVYVSDQYSNENDYINVIVHEIAHQWWYGLVGSNAFAEGWLDEGLTEYSTILFYKENPSYNIDTVEIIKATTNSYVTFVDLYSSVLGEVNTSMNRKLNEFQTEPEYVYIAYVKGMLLFNTLHESIGDKKFINSLKYYFEKHQFTNTNSTDLINCFEKTSRTNLKSFFDSWINGKVEIIAI